MKLLDDTFLSFL